MQVRAEKSPSMPVEELQAHSINIIQHLHHDADHPGVPDEVRQMLLGCRNCSGHCTWPEVKAHCLPYGRGSAEMVLPDAPWHANACKLQICCQQCDNVNWGTCVSSQVLSILECIAWAQALSTGMGCYAVSNCCVARHTGRCESVVSCLCCTSQKVGSPKHCWCVFVQVHNPSEAPAIRDNLRDSEQKLKDAHDPL